MPDCIGDVKVLKRTLQKNKKLVNIADTKILNAVKNMKQGNPKREGLNIFYHAAGLIGQRL
jgi:hypothetical protein